MQKVEQFVAQESNIVTEITNETKTKRLNAFWVVENTPGADASKLKMIKCTPMCKADKPHSISMKKLIPVIFSQADGKSHCPVCVKSISIGMPLSLLKSCGHVLCKACCDKFIVKDKSDKCPICAGKCKSKDIIQLATDGTGFSSKGNAVAEKETTAFH
jgi:nitric oxide synthase-interacting protein